MRKCIDLTNQIFDHLTVIERNGTNKSGHSTWLCGCRCGNEIIKERKLLITSKRYQSCGCIPKYEKIEGQVFNYWTAKKFIKFTNLGSYWLFECRCGKTKTYNYKKLKSSGVKSCGCHRDTEKAGYADRIIARKFRSWKVLRYDRDFKSRDGSVKRKYICRCVCGIEKSFTLQYIISKKLPPSCGCHIIMGLGKKYYTSYLSNNKKQYKGNNGFKKRIETPELKKQYQDWRKKVFKKNGRQCQICGKKRHLIIHHCYAWASYPSLRYNVENGWVLCGGRGSCHDLFHRIYGKGKNTLQQVVEFKNRYSGFLKK